MHAGGDLERTFAIGQRALELIKAYGSSANPRSYEVWYTYVSGQKPLMNDAIKRLTTQQGSLTEDDVDALYDQHLSPQRFSAQAESAGTAMLAEIDEVMAMIDLAVGSTTRYGESLVAFSDDLKGPVDRTRIRAIVGSMVAATHEVQGTNRLLEARLKETRVEIETLRETLETVRVEALTDPLTGIANRKHFEEALLRAVEQAVDQRSPLALVVIDIDHFKHFNDTYGHLTGDQVLRLVSMTMRENVKAKATVARFGGEEFGIILPETTLETARGTAELIRESVMKRELVKRSTGETLGKVTISVGVASLRRGDTAPTLLERADQCMYGAKRGGRNRTVIDREFLPEAMPDVA